MEIQGTGNIQHYLQKKENGKNYIFYFLNLIQKHSNQESVIFT